MYSRRILLALAAAGSLFLTLPAAAEDPPVIAAASDLQFALEEIAAAFTEDTGQAVSLSFGSTGNFARQIREGAPFQMFLAADESFVLDLARDGFTRDEGQLYAEGRIVIQVPEGSTLAADGTLESLRVALDEGRITRFAIANPEHAPYGKRAEEALRHAGLWEPIQPFLVLGENVSQAAQFALSGNAEGGIIAYSLALAPQLESKGSYALIPAEWHQPLLQRMVLLKDAGPVAEAFYAYMAAPPARAIMDRYGFQLPQG
jgi:molybdate transport system substrate-binding protein